MCVSWHAHHVAWSRWPKICGQHAESPCATAVYDAYKQLQAAADSAATCPALRPAIPRIHKLEAALQLALSPVPAPVLDDTLVTTCMQQEASGHLQTLSIGFATGLDNLRANSPLELLPATSELPRDSLQRSSMTQILGLRQDSTRRTTLQRGSIVRLAGPVRTHALQELARVPKQPCPLASAALWQGEWAQEVLCSGPDTQRLVHGACGVAAFSPDGQRLAVAVEQLRSRWAIQVCFAALLVCRSQLHYSAELFSVPLHGHDIVCHAAMHIPALYLRGDVVSTAFCAQSAKPHGLPTLSAANIMQVFDALTAAPLSGCKFAGHVGLIYDLCWSPDSRLLASAAADCTTKVWHVDWAAEAAGDVPQSGTWGAQDTLHRCAGARWCLTIQHHTYAYACCFQPAVPEQELPDASMPLPTAAEDKASDKHTQDASQPACRWLLATGCAGAVLRLHLIEGGSATARELAAPDARTLHPQHSWGASPAAAAVTALAWVASDKGPECQAVSALYTGVPMPPGAS